MKTLPADLSEKIDVIASWMFPVGSQKRIVELSGLPQNRVSEMLNKKKYPTPEFMNAAEKVVHENRVRFKMDSILKVS